MSVVVKKLLFVSIMVLFQAAARPKVILFYGDSLTAGYGLSTEEAFPAVISRTLTQRGTPATVVNAGLSGETSAGGLNRLDWVLKQPIDIFVLELGANDGLRGLPLQETQKNLQGIIDKVVAKYPSAKIVIAGMLVPPNLGPDYTTQFSRIFPDLAKKNKAALIPFLLQGVAGDDKLNNSDGIHPNVKGHQIVAVTVLKALEPFL